MMDGVFEEMEDEGLQEEDKSICEKLLLTISCKEKLFNESQRELARKILKKLEGNRRRRCRDNDENSRFSSSNNEPGTPEVNERLMIRSSKKRRKKRGSKNGEDDTPTSNRKRGRRSLMNKMSDAAYADNSESDGDWSGAEDTMVKKKKDGISKKEARRRRAWASGKDAAASAGLTWPSFPREKVEGVLSSLLDKVIQNDEDKGGIFSQPVPKDEFPDYYEVIKTPMDYSTMKSKLTRGEYRSAQAMQKDFVLIMANCVQFNAKNSDIVKEARKQVLLRPAFLKEAAMENNLFLAEDGAVIDVYSDDEDAVGITNDDAKPVKKRRGRKPGPKKMKKEVTKVVRCNECGPCSKEDCGECDACKDKKKFGGSGSLRQSCMHRNCENLQEVVVKPRRGRPPKKKNRAEDESDTSDHGGYLARSVGVHVSLNSPGGTEESSELCSQIPKKRKKSVDREGGDGVNEDLSDGEIGESPAAKRSRGEIGKFSSYLDYQILEEERANLDPSFESARNHFTKRGAWVLPREVENKFHEVARATITLVSKLDVFDLFQRAVTEDDHPGYSDVVKNPMDFGKMLKKLESGEYDNGGIPRVYEHFLLVLDNCSLYNSDNDEVLKEAARLLSQLPETFAKACVGIRDKSKT